jgi:hypothetical protein
VTPSRSFLWLVLASTLAPGREAQASPALAPQPGAEAVEAPEETGEPAAVEAEEPVEKVLVPTGLRLNRPDRWIQFKAAVELGFLAPLHHRIQFSKSGTYFDYVEEGNQDNLFFFTRVSAEIEIVRHHTIIFLYQPLSLETHAVMGRDVVVDELTFPEGTAVDLVYGFDFYRFSYLYDIFKDPGVELAVGLSLQIRNASIGFTSADGTLRRVRNNIGPVPIVKIRARYTFRPGVFIGTELDGWWASGKYVSGSSKDFDAAILDASLRFGIDVTEFAETFVNLRYVGGGARGKGKEGDEPGDGFTRNWIHLLIFSIGIGLG